MFAAASARLHLPAEQGSGGTPLLPEVSRPAPGLVMGAARVAAREWSEGASGRSRLVTLAPWLLGSVAAILVLGPALAPGPLLGLDLVITPEVPVPRGVWGLGPDLPRRVPLGIALAWASAAVGGPLAAKVLFALCLVVAFAGAWRLASPAPVLCRVSTALLYTLSPFTLTRLGVGHWMLLASIAVLPWALPHLVRPSHDLARTFLWAAALGTTGVNGGLYAAALVSIGLIAERGRGATRVVPLFVLAQLPWLVPGAIVLTSAPDLADPGSFATRAPGLSGLLGLVVGGGFWRQASQVGVASGTGRALLGAGLMGVALLGARRLPRAWGGRAAAAAALGFAAAAGSALPGIATVYEELAATPLGAALREGQRMLVLFLVWWAPAVATGIRRLEEGIGRPLVPVVRAMPGAAAVALALPALWGVGGALEPVSFPPGWSEARQVVARQRGTVLALPWHQYLDLSFAGGRRVFNPVPDYFGGDVIWSSDPELGGPSEEQADPREGHAREVARQVRLGRPPSAALARLGVRWVVLLHEVDWRRYQSLSRDPGLQLAVETEAIELFEVRSWKAPIVAEDGAVVASRELVAPLSWVDVSGPAIWRRPGLSGWMRGTAPAGRSERGLVRLPAGGGVVWYWPAAPTLIAHAATGATAVAFACRLHPRRPRGSALRAWPRQRRPTSGHSPPRG
ncbi:MAG: DUF3367 domain-containing protein [Actinomycetota bacterium]|nr:DUF3367 domain-containing protein [Actinomycetota bacterium]